MQKKQQNNATIIRILDFGGNFINYKMAIIGAVIMGSIVGIINADHGIFLASFAGMKQAIYTFFFGGIIIKILETIALRINNKVIAVVAAVFITSLITITLVFIVHQLKGTPKPVESTLPTVIMAPPGFLFLAIRKRRQEEIGREH